MGELFKSKIYQFGYYLNFTLLKISNEYLAEQRKIADSSADEVASAALKSKDRLIYQVLQRSIHEIIHSEDEDPVTQFLQSKEATPEWFDSERIKQGQKVYEKYAAEIMILLGVMALPYCYAGSPGNKALYMSDKMRNNPGKRLMDTAEFLIGVSTPGSFEGEGEGFIHIRKTRLIHANARYYVGKSAWNDEWGSPINQEDMAGTNLAFSYIILNGLRKSGYTLTEKEQADFMYLWKFIGYQLGIDEQLLPDNYQDGFKLANLIKRRNFQYSQEGVELTRELMNYYESNAHKAQSKLVKAQVKYFLGRKISGYIGIETNPISDTLVEVANGFSQLQNYFSSHESSYGAMIRDFQRAKRTQA